MKRVVRPDDFEHRREHLRGMSDEVLHDYFWQLVAGIVDPLIQEARTHTTPSIERSVLMRMGFNSMDAKALVDAMSERRLLGHGAGRLVLELAKAKSMSIEQAGAALLAGDHWEDLRS